MKNFNPTRSKNFRQHLRNNLTPPEKILWQYLKSNQLGYKFRRQHGIGKYIVDFYCAPLYLVVEIDGTVHGETVIVKKDEIREEFLKNLHLRIKRYTAREIYNELEGVLDDLQRYCAELTKTPEVRIRSFSKRANNPS